MNNQDKTNAELIEEISRLNQRIRELELSDSERKRMEQTLRESEGKFRILVENANDIVYSLTLDGVFTYVSPTWTRVLGHDISEVENHPFQPFVHPEDLPGCLEFLERAIKTGEKQAGIEYRVLHKDGNWRWHTTNASPIHDANGKVVAGVGISRDITERKRIEEALRESEEKLLMALYGAEMGMWELDLTTMSGTIDERAAQILGYQKDEIPSQIHAWDKITHPDDIPHIKERIKAHLEGRMPVFKTDHRMRMATSEWKWVHGRGKITKSHIDGSPIRISGTIHDITERKLVEEALQESEERYREFFATSRDCVFITSMEGKWIDFNDAALEMFGYDSREELSQVSISSLYVNPEERSVLTALIEQQGYVKEHPVLLRRRDGAVIDALITSGFRRNADGSEREYYGTIRDITKRKNTEKEKRRLEERLHTLVHTIPDLIWLKDADGVYLSCNKMFELFFGAKEADIIGKTDYDFVSKELADFFLEHDRKAMALGKPSSNEEWITFASDSHRALLDTIKTPMYDAGGTLIGVLGIGRDITERKWAEEALRETQRRLTDIIEFLPDATLVIDRDGKVIAWNRAIESMTGVRAEEMLGKGNYEHALPFYGERRPILIDLALHPDPETEQPYTTIQRERDILFGESYSPGLPPGDVHLSATASVLRDSKGEIIAAIECIRDNTERKRLEERLQRAEKMEALGTLAGGVAHDLNNVLGIVVGYAELLLNSVDESSSIRPSLLNIMNGGQRAAAIVQDLLTLARRGVPGQKVLNLNKIIADCQQSPEFTNISDLHSSMRLKLDLDPELLNISGSSVHLGKTLLNLVSNAGEAMPNGGIVTIKTANQYLDKPIQGYDEVREGDYVVLSVSDTGEGIPAADLKRIFEPFYTKKVMGRSGTGLGLAVVWGTVKDHHGYINVESEEGKGSTFTLYLPVTREDISSEAVAVSISEYMGRGESILIVDDVKGQRDLAAEMLQRLNYKVASVSSGEAAVAYLKEHQVDLIVLDMIMDLGMDGLDTYRSILEIHPDQKAIIVSGFSETYRVSAAQGLGAGAYVRKPYVIEKLGLAVRKELDRK